MFPIPLFLRALAGAAGIACAACAGVPPRPEVDDAPRTFYTVTGEIALSRHEPRVAALEYVAATETGRDLGLLERAADVTTECLQPSLTGLVADRWIDLAPGSSDAHRAAARAALALHRIERAAAQYRAMIDASPRGAEAELGSLEHELAGADNVYGARQVADRLVGYYPDSTVALRIQAFAAMRADDPAAAVRSFRAVLAATTDVDARRDVSQSLQRARILAGDRDEPLAEARAGLAAAGSSLERLDYAVLLLAAQDSEAARGELTPLTRDADTAPTALRLLGLIDFQDGKLDDAAARFKELAASGKFPDDALYYLGVIAERHGDVDRALQFYAQVQSGDNVVQALMRAASLLRAHGAAPAAEKLLDRLVEEEPARAPEILASRARIYVQAGEMPRAAALLEAALVQYPDSVELRYASASLDEDRGHVDSALRQLKALAELRPDDPAALNAYGYTLADHDRKLGRARQLIERAHAAAPNNAAILDSVGWVLYRQGHGDEALPYLHQAYADDRSGDMAAHLGEVLWQLGRQDDARRVWSEGAAVDVDNPLLKSTRQRLRASN